MSKEEIATGVAHGVPEDLRSILIADEGYELDGRKLRSFHLLHFPQVMATL